MVREAESKKKNSETMKFLCSYSGKIHPRSIDGKLRYVGGFTRVLSIDRSISYAELMVKLVEFCGFSVTLRCSLPNGDLDMLISIKSEEDLKNIIALYEEAASKSPSAPSKIRAILSPPQSLKQISPLPSRSPSVNSSSPKSANFDSSKSSSSTSTSSRSGGRTFCPSPPITYTVKNCYYPCHLRHQPRIQYNAPRSCGCCLYGR